VLRKSETGNQDSVILSTTPISVGIVSLGACALAEPGSGFPAGGAEVQLYIIARMLAAEEDFRVTLHVADIGQPERVENGLRIKPLVRLKPGLQISATAAPAIVGRLARERHRVCVTRSASSISGLTQIAALLCGGRHMHMCANDNECAGRADATLSKPAKWLQNMGLRRSDMVTCQTIRQIELLRNRFGIEGFLAPNISPDLFAVPADGPREGALWVGRDVDGKAPELFIELARRLPDHPFTMICQPQPGRDFHRLAAIAPKNLRLVPGLPIQETAPLFARHRVFALTSLSEGFPNVLLQSARSGTPVVSLCVDPDNILSSNKAGFACQGSFDEVVRRTAELLTDPSLWKECHEGALRLTRETEGSGERIIGLIRSLAAP
jgi:glycosyltransferase involved in cell wall biosynthesis